jgi:hypothetical protein
MANFFWGGMVKLLATGTLFFLCKSRRFCELRLEEGRGGVESKEPTESAPFIYHPGILNLSRTLPPPLVLRSFAFTRGSAPGGYKNS